jgi:hypothetical protein
MSSFRDGPIRGRTPAQWLHLAVLTTAVLALLFVASGAALWHLDAPGSADTCPICHAVNMPALHAVRAGNLTSLAIATWLEIPETRTTHVPPAASSAPPRAPPV